MEARFFDSPAEWRAWLEANHETAADVVVGFYRKATGRIAKVAALEEAGKMTAAGRAAFERRREDRSGVYSFEQAERPEALPEPYAAALAADAAAQAHFDARPPWYRRAAVHWVTSAKREATRERRLAVLIESSRAGEEVPPLGRFRAQAAVIPIGQETPVPPSPQ